jgi:hypothetical protein
MMQSTQIEPQSKFRRAMSDIVVVEMMLVQTIIESTSLIGECIVEVNAQVEGGENGETTVEPIRNILLRTRDDVVDSYTSNFSYLRQLNDKK